MTGMKRLWFLYYSHGAATPDRIPEYHADVVSHNFYLQQFKSDGLYYVFKKMLAQGIADEITVVMESNRSPGSMQTGITGLHCITIPHISLLNSMIQPGDLIWTRGGFRGWCEWLQQKQKQGHWMVLYAANTGRERWPWWDIVLHDCDGPAPNDFDASGRFIWDYRKPINPEVFYPTPPAYSYDIMIGASNVTDKKGQYKVIQGLAEYKKAFGALPRCILPGGARHGTRTTPALRLCRELGVREVGPISRMELADYMRHTRYFIHAGESGQNDRGPLEAMACGCVVSLNAPHRHHHSLSSTDSGVIEFDYSSPVDTARFLRGLLGESESSLLARRKKSLRFFGETHGVDREIVPRLSRMISFLFNNQRSEKQRLKNEI